MLLMAAAGFAQQSAIYSQYMFNHFIVNPAYAGSRDALSGVLLFRQQWTGIKGAPQTQTFSMHSVIGKTQAAAGINVVNDMVGPSRHTGVFLTGAYHLQMPAGKLSFGLRGGIYNARLDNSKLSYYDPNDVLNTQTVANTTVPSFDAGLYYYTRHFYLGISAAHLTKTRFNFNNYPEASMSLKRHFMLATGYAFELSKKLVFKPSALVKYVEGAPVNIDLNASFLINRVIWLGSSFRSNNGLTFMAEYYFTKSFRAGYSYDMLMNKARKYALGTHEIVISFDIDIQHAKFVSTRFL